MAKSITHKGQTQTITIKGAEVQVTPAQLARARKNTDALKAQIKVGRGAEKHEWHDLCAYILDDYQGMVGDAKNILERQFNMGRNLLALRAMLGSDKEFGAKIKSEGLHVIPSQDRNDAMWLAKNEKLVRSAIKSGDIPLNGLGVSALRKRAKAHATETGTPTASVTDRDTSAKTAEGKAKVAAKSAKGKAKDKPVQKAKPKTADDIASDALEAAIANGITPADLMTAIAKAVAEAMQEAA